MRDHRIATTAIAIVTIAAGSLLSGCMLGPRPLSVEENIWFNIATGSDVYAVPPPSPYYPPYARPYPAYVQPHRLYARPAPAYAQPAPAPEFVPAEPEPR